MQHDIHIQQTAEQCASFDWFPKSVKIPTKKGESVDEIPLMALCFQFIRTKIRVYPSISFYIRV